MMHSKDFCKRVVNLRVKDNLSAAEVAAKMNYEYYRETGRTMTKNVVIGIWNRNKNLISQEDLEKQKDKATKKAINFNKLMSERKKIKPSQFRVRKCLSCRKEVLLEKNLYICNPCKGNENYTYDMVTHSYSSGTKA